MLPLRDPPQKKSPSQTKREEIERNIPSNGQEKKKSGNQYSYQKKDKIDFKKRDIKREPEGYFIILMGRIHQEDINLVNIYEPNIGAPKYIRKIVEDFEKDN